VDGVSGGARVCVCAVCVSVCLCVSVCAVCVRLCVWYLGVLCVSLSFVTTQ
jgi:hypothetical protein